MWVSFVNERNPNHHGISKYKGQSIPQWPLYASNGREAEQGYAKNYYFGVSGSTIAAVEDDTWRAESIAYMIANRGEYFGI